MLKPSISTGLKYSFKNIHAIIAEVGGTKKKSVTVLLAEPLWSIYIKIENAPKETKKIWWLMATRNVDVKFIYGVSKNKIIILWKKNPPIAWYILLTVKGKLLVIFFCHKVAAVTDIKEMNAAKTAIIGRVFPISKPKTRIAPKKPKKTPIHCFQFTFSFKSFPAKAFVSIGCRVTINATIPVGNPCETEKKTPPK